jgi:hypothetical protein
MDEFALLDEFLFNLSNEDFNMKWVIWFNKIIELRFAKYETRRSFRSEKFLHHCVQRVTNEKNLKNLLGWVKKKIFFLGGVFALFGNFNKNRVF